MSSLTVISIRCGLSKSYMGMFSVASRVCTSCTSISSMAVCGRSDAPVENERKGSSMTSRRGQMFLLCALYETANGHVHNVLINKGENHCCYICILFTTTMDLSL